MTNNRPLLKTAGFFLLFHILLLCTMRLLPFVDLPNHLAEATIFKYASESDYLGQYYEAVPGFYPNTFHTVFCALFPSVEIGNKAFFVLYVMLLVGSVLLVIRELKGNRWYGLLCVLFIYNYNTTYGFVGFAIAIPVTILLFYVALRDIRSQRYPFTFLAGFLLVLLYLMHAQVALFGLLLYGLMLLRGFWGRWMPMLFKGLVAITPVLVMVVLWWMHRTAQQQEQSTLSFLADYYRYRYLPEFSMRFKGIIFDHMSLTEGKIIPFLLNVAVVVPVLCLLLTKKIKLGNWQHPSVFYPSLLFGVSLACYILLPKDLPGQGPVHERLITFVFLSLIILGSVWMKDISARGLRVYAVGVCLAYSLLWGEYFYTFNRTNQHFTAGFFDGLTAQQKLAGLMYDYKFRGREVYIHFPNYNLVWNRGLTASKMIDYRFGVVRRGQKGTEIPFYEDWVGREYKVLQDYRQNVQYLLQNGQPPVELDSNTLHYRLIRQAGNWKIYESGERMNSRSMGIR